MTSIVVSAPIVPGVAFAVAFPIIFLAFACVLSQLPLQLQKKKPCPPILEMNVSASLMAIFLMNLQLPNASCKP